MKWVLLTYLLILSIGTSHSQTTYTDSTSIILPLLHEFKHESRKRGLYLDGMIAKHLSGINVVDSTTMAKIKLVDGKPPLGIVHRKLREGLYGYIFLDTHITIQEKCLSYPAHLRWVIFHELGHFVGLNKHSTSGMMSEGIDLHSALTDDEWNTMLDDFFNTIKNNPNNNYWFRQDNTFY